MSWWFFMNWDSEKIKTLIDRALQEDIGSGDITTRTLVSEPSIRSAVFMAKENGIIAGLPLLSRIFRHLQHDCTFRESIHEGQNLVPNARICEVTGNCTSLLAGERVALNFLQRLSGIATRTAAYVALAAPYSIAVLDTRKTTPLLREVEKYAVTVGGGVNHRFGLYDGILVKDNHLKIQSDFASILQKFSKAGYSSDKIELEVTSLEMLEEAMKAGARWFLLDNMTPEMIEECVKRKRDNMKFEVSGGINLLNFSQFLIQGVDGISIGALTHSVKSLDISTEIV